MGVGFGDLGFGELGGRDGDGEGGMDVWRRQKGLVFRVKSNGLKGRRRRLSVHVVHHGVTFVVVSGSRVCKGGENTAQGIQ